jgi:hypothetical protein
MRENCKKNGPGTGLICAGAVVFLIGLTIILFKELDIPRYWITAFIGIALMVAGVIVHGIKRVCGHQETESK